MASRPKPRVLVAQLGARRHYLVPFSLHRGGHLERFCTDLYFGRRPWIDPLAARLLGRRFRGFPGRRHPALPVSLVSDYPAVSLVSMTRGGSPCGRWIRTGKRFADSVVRQGFGAADTVVAFSSAALEIFEAASAPGLLRVLDHATAPRDVEMAAVAREEERFPGWAAEPVVQDHRLEAYADRQRRERALADRILCGSSFVAAGLAADGATDRARLRVVPLGIAPVATSLEERPRRTGELKVLFAGNEGLRKGLGYLVEAIAMLESRRIRLRVAGNPGFSPLGMRELGRFCEDCRVVSRGEMPAWYRWADVLVLPSVSDTFGMVILEAMAAGVPVIASTASAAPDVVRGGVDGWIVPVRDAAAIAAKLDHLAAHESLSRDMGWAARTRAADFSVDAYAARLLEAIAA